MADNIMQMCYLNLMLIVRSIHRRIYKGANNRNRYQIAPHIYVWWDNDMLVKIMNTKENYTMHFSLQDMRVTKGYVLRNLGFYVDIQEDVQQEIKKQYSEAKIQSLIDPNNPQDLTPCLDKDLQIIEQYLKQKGLTS